MRPALAAFLSCVVLTASSAGQQQVFPYKAVVTSDDVYVRSGPGHGYYPTDKLKAGQEVEVYRHVPGGWYAIRPPEGSFSWVSGRFLQPGLENLAVVSGDRVAARVGSRFSDIRDVIQVRLNKAEVVEVLEKKQSPSGSDRGIWYKIAPPSGEFRWIFGKYVDRDYPRDGLRKPRAAGVETGRVDVNAPQGPRPDTVAPPLQQVARGPSVAIPGGPRGADRRGFDQASPREISPEQFQAKLEEIDMELSVMVIEEPTVWTFDEMQQRTEALLAQANTALERGRARVLLNKLSRFEDIRSRYHTLTATRQQTEHANRRLAGLRPRDRRGAGGNQPESRFDGEGELIRVVSPKLGAPRYALVDELGEVRCYVSPAPGVPMRHYLGRRVGVTGSRGYMPEQHARHVMARHISVLDDRRLR
jgi:SH3-like domain-containing protein